MIQAWKFERKGWWNSLLMIFVFSVNLRSSLQWKSKKLEDVNPCSILKIELTREKQQESVQNWTGTVGVLYWTGTWRSGGDDKKVKERKRLILPGLRRKPIKSLTQDLHLSRRHRAPSRGGWRQRAPSRESLRSPGRRVRLVSALQGISRGQWERERKKERKTWGPTLWWSKGALMIFLWVYIGCSTRSLFCQW